MGKVSVPGEASNIGEGVLEGVLGQHLNILRNRVNGIFSQ